MNVQYLHLETDCLELVQLWENRSSQRSIIAPVLRAMEELSLAFNSFVFSHVNRKCNQVAHALTRQVTSTNRSGMWHITPACISDLLAADLSFPP